MEFPSSNETLDARFYVGGWFSSQRIWTDRFGQKMLFDRVVCIVGKPSNNNGNMLPGGRLFCKEKHTLQ
jgi:hypothetical protein